MDPPDRGRARRWARAPVHGSDSVLARARARMGARTAVALVLLGLAVVVLGPRTGELAAVREELAAADWRWLVPVVVFEALTYVGAAISLASSVHDRIPLRPTIRAQVAAAFVDVVSPHSVGGMALNVRFLHRHGVEPGAAVAGVAVNVVGGVVAHLLVLAGFVIAGRGPTVGDSGHLPAPTVPPLVLAAMVLVIVVGGAAAASAAGRRLLRRRVWPHLADARTGLHGIARQPRKILGVVGGSVVTTIAFTGSFVATVQAFGGGISLAVLGATYLGAWAVAAFAPTPGGLGALELALVAGLTRAGMSGDTALSVVVVFRTITFWMPVLPGWVCFHRIQRRREI